MYVVRMAMEMKKTSLAILTREDEEAPEAIETPTDKDTY